MKPDNRVAKHAKLLVHYSVGVREKEKVSIMGSTASESLLREIYKEVLRCGAHPRVTMQFTDQEYFFYHLSKDYQLEYTDPFTLYEFENNDIIISVFPNLNPHALTSIGSEKKQKFVLSQKPLMDMVFKRWGEGNLRWVGTVCPSPALAQEAHMSFEEYCEFVFSCMHLNEGNPVDFWRDFSQRQEKLCNQLNQKKNFQLLGEDTDLRFCSEGRTWINCDGRNNFPDGEVFTGPIEDSVEGSIRFTYPGIVHGEEVEDIFLKFEKGKVVKAKASKGQSLLEKMLETDEGAKYVGEIAFGTNEHINKFTKNILFDEKMGGTIHLAIGRGLPNSGSQNQSVIHWDMLKNMREGGKIYADKKLIYKDGQFLI
jgi:aminopeptidase